MASAYPEAAGRRAPSELGTVASMGKVRELSETKGPMREIHAGSGYWSQDSAVQVLSSPADLDALWVRWPGGGIVTAKLPAQATEIQVGESGEVQLVR